MPPVPPPSTICGVRTARAPGRLRAPPHTRRCAAPPCALAQSSTRYPRPPARPAPSQAPLPHAPLAAAAHPPLLAVDEAALPQVLGRPVSGDNASGVISTDRGAACCPTSNHHGRRRARRHPRGVLAVRRKAGRRAAQHQNPLLQRCILPLVYGKPTQSAQPRSMQLRPAQSMRSWCLQGNERMQVKISEACFSKGLCTASHV